MANGRIDENGLPVYAPGDFDYVRVVDRSTGASRNALVPEVTAAARLLTEKLDEVVADAEADIAPVIAGLGYLPPVPYASGLAVDSTRFTVIRDGQVYAPAAPVPFTTGTWDAGQWRLVQGVTGADLAAPTGAKMVGYSDPIAPAYLKTVSDMLNGDPVSAFRFIPPTRHAAIREHTSTFDTQPGLQDGVDALADIGKGTLVLPIGRFVTNSEITWRSRVSLVGQGAGASKIAMHGDIFSAIHQTSQGTADGNLTGAPLDDVMFANFEIDGSGLTFSGSSVNGKGLFILYMRRAKFLNLYIHDTIGTGLGCDFLDDTLIHGCVVERAGRNYGQPGSTGGQSGIGIGTGWKSVESVTISDCHAIDCGNYGIFVEIQKSFDPATHDPDTLPRGARIVNCYARGNRIGIGNRGSGPTLFMGCDAVGNTADGFALSRGSFGDQIIGCLAEGNGGSGILADTYLGQLQVANTRCLNNSNNGFLLNNPGSSLIVTKGIHINGGEFIGNARRGITISSNNGLRDYSIRNATVADNGTALVSGNRQGIAISGVAEDGVIANNWFGNSVGSSSQGSAVQMYNTANGLSIQGNTCARQVGDAFSIQEGSTDVTIRSNPGYNSPGVALSIPTQPSPWEYSAPTFTDEMVYLEGTGIQVSIGGSVIYNNVESCSFLLPANASAEITYTTLTRARRMRL